ncbi:MAG: N-acetylmuramic acid 6-phosphate etherase [Gemmatimonadales bacterium]
MDSRLTERRNPRTADIDVATSYEIVEMLNREDAEALAAVRAVREAVVRTIEIVVSAFGAGGRLIYVGAGTSGRLGVLDAAECPPTFGSPPELVSAIIAGGLPALTKSQEGAEDDSEAGALELAAREPSKNDVVIGIAASGTTPFVRGAILSAQDFGCKTALITCSDPPGDLAAICDEVVVARVGPEAVTGSTRLKAGTATKLILNSITTAAMIRSGKVYGNLMVDLMASSDKLTDRGERIVMEVCDVERDVARQAIEDAGGSVKLAIVMLGLGENANEARRRLDAAQGFVRKVLGDPPPVTG